jgi:hypothetical protein
MFMMKNSSAHSFMSNGQIYERRRQSRKIFVQLNSEKDKNITGITTIFGQINLLHQRFLSKKNSRRHLESKEGNTIYGNLLVSSKEKNIMYGSHLPVVNYDGQGFGIQKREIKVSPCSPSCNQSFSATEAQVNKFYFNRDNYHFNRDYYQLSAKKISS